MKLTIQWLFLAQLAFGVCLAASHASAAEPATVAYRLKNTKTIHFDDVQEGSSTS